MIILHYVTIVFILSFAKAMGDKKHLSMKLKLIQLCSAPDSICTGTRVELNPGAFLRSRAHRIATTTVTATSATLMYVSLFLSIVLP